MKDHIIELRRKIWSHDWSSQLYTHFKQLWNFLNILNLCGLNNGAGLIVKLLLNIDAIYLSLYFPLNVLPIFLLSQS